MGVVNQLSSWIQGLSVKIKNLRALTSTSAVFPKIITADQEEEFNNLKKALKEKVSLSPLDTNYPLELWTDASYEGLGYVLTQKKEKENEDGKKIMDRIIIFVGSTGLTPS